MHRPFNAERFGHRYGIWSILLCWLMLSAPAGATLNDNDPLILQLKWKHQFQFAGYYMAEAKGFYREAGLNVSIKEADRGQDPLQEVLAKRAHYGIGSSELVIQHAEGAPVVILAPIYQHSPLVLLVKQSADLRSIHDLQDKRLMMEPQSAQLLAYFAAEGLERQQLQLQEHRFDVDALLNGEVDGLSAYSTDEPYLLNQAHFPYLMFTPRSNGMDFYGDTLFTSQAELRQSPERVKAFREASLKGWSYALEHPEESIELILSRYSQRHSREHLRYEARETWELIRPDLIEIGYSNPGRWQHIVNLYSQHGLLTQKVSLEHFLYQHTTHTPIWLYSAMVALGLLALALAASLFLFHRLNRHLQHQIRERDHMDTFLRQAQSETLKVNHELQEVLQEAHELAQAATAANQAKSEFLANMSHEIRTPLNGVLGMLALLEESELSSEQRHYAEVAHISANILLTVIGDILDFARIEARKVALEQISLPLRQLVEEVILVMAMRAREKSLELVYYLDPQVPETVEGDPDRLRQVLLNLLSNAIKFTDAGEVSLEVAWNPDRPATPLAFHIYDTGIGIPSERHSKLFQPFQQLDSSITRKYGGTGLGLAICQQLVQLMGGEIGSSERQGKGAHFWVRLPCTAGAQIPPPKSLHLAGQHFYLALQHPLTQKTASDLLSQWGAEVSSVQDRQQLTEALNNKSTQAHHTLFWEAGFDPTQGLEALSDFQQRFPWLNSILLLPLGDQAGMAEAQARGLRFLQQPLRAHEMKTLLQQNLASLSLGAHHALNLQILLVEDNPINQVVSEAILQKLGCQSHCVSDGQEALAALQATDYDLVLMDLQMPVMDGFEAIQKIRQGPPKWQTLPVIAMTAHAIQGDAQHCLNVGFSDYLPKPYEIKQLEQLLARWSPLKL